MNPGSNVVWGEFFYWPFHSLIQISTIYHFSCYVLLCLKMNLTTGLLIKNSRGIYWGFSPNLAPKISVAEVQFRTDAENQNRQNRTESSVQFSSGSPVLAAVRFSVLRIPKNARTDWEPVKIYTWSTKKTCKMAHMWCKKVIICRKKSLIELCRQGFRSFKWLVITKYGNSLSISCFLALVPSKTH